MEGCFEVKLENLSKEVIEVLEDKCQEDYEFLYECDDDDFFGWGVSVLNRLNPILKFLGQETLRFEDIRAERFDAVLSVRVKAKEK